MNLGWIITGIILLGGMTAAGISLYIKRRKESQALTDSFTGIQSDLTNIKNDDSK